MEAETLNQTFVCTETVDHPEGVHKALVVTTQEAPSA